MIYITNYNSPVGKLLLASDGKNLTGLWIEGQECSLDQNNTKLNNDLDIFKKTKNWLDRYFAGKRVEVCELDIRFNGTEFQKIVWKILCEIPYGEFTTYGNIAKKVAKILNKEKMSAQAVGGAVGHNPISIIVPCHRVIGTNGSLTGYAGGIDKKIKLLQIEGHDMTKFKNCD